MPEGEYTERDGAWYWEGPYTTLGPFLTEEEARWAVTDFYRSDDEPLHLDGA